jgi:hypothetical protein
MEALVDHRIELTIDLPFWLKVEGKSSVRIGDCHGQLTIESVHRDKVAIPGVALLQGGRLLHDDTNYIAHSRLVADLVLSAPEEESARRLFLFQEVPVVATRLSNLVINSARLHLEDYILRPLAGAHELQAISIQHLVDGKKSFATHTTYPSAITNSALTYTDAQRANFCRRIEEGLELHLHQALYLDAETYRLKLNPRMAAANLSLSFEVFLHFILETFEIPVSEKWTMWKLGTAGIAQVFGEGLDQEERWGAEAVANFRLLKSLRNMVMHRAGTVLLVGAVTLDLNMEADIGRVFAAFVSLTGLILKESVALQNGGS